jgi:hypothetical protein
MAAQGITVYVCHFRDGQTHKVVYTGGEEGDARWVSVRRMARDASANHNGVQKIVRESTGQTVWRSTLQRKPHKKGRRRI